MYKTGIRKADSCPQTTVTQMVSHPWNMGWGDSSWRELKPGGAQCRGAGSMWQEMWPHDGPGVPPALCMSPQSPDAGGTSCRETKPASPKNWWNLWTGTGFQGPLACLCPLGWGSYLQPPSLGSPHLQLTAPSAEWCPKKLVHILGTLGKREGEKIQALGVSSGTVHSSWQSMNRVFHETQCLWARVGQEAMLFPKGHLPEKRL